MQWMFGHMSKLGWKQLSKGGQSSSVLNQHQVLKLAPPCWTISRDDLSSGSCATNLLNPLQAKRRQEKRINMYLCRPLKYLSCYFTFWQHSDWHILHDINVHNVRDFQYWFSAFRDYAHIGMYTFRFKQIALFGDSINNGRDLQILQFLVKNRSYKKCAEK